ncbi:MAG: PIG-L family deacetylase [Acidimicrobiia bacterium]|nr:PIG-L family deacetylase [Acidimicrobiia bacterium]MBT8216012.1 PIG-L family deacetylase [Acidimicrobiia bacterium]NNF10745.1 PIG-L family deacetylase [Acidimicrobiia bacterium]NNL69226.1 PIG-L family deacetylase [Acidimicrobiia bacterium]
MTTLAVPGRALAIGAHPDDIEFGAGGTLAGWASRGCEVVMAVMTDGSKGSWDPEEIPAALVARRADEQRNAARILGASRVEKLGHVDGELVNTLEVRRQVAGLIRTHRPDVVLSHDPWAPYELHPDHRATGWAVVDGAVAARDHLFYPDEPLNHHRPELLLLWRAAQPDHWQDINATFEIKLAALLAHESQHQTTMANAGAGETEREAFAAQVRARAAQEGVAGGLALAEAFKQLAL